MSGAVRHKHWRLVLSLGVEVSLVGLLSAGVLVHVSIHAAVSDFRAVRVPIELAALFMVSCPVHWLPVEVQTLVVLGGPEQESSHLILEVDVLVLSCDRIDELALKLDKIEAELVLEGLDLDFFPGFDGRVHLPDAYHLRKDLDRESDSDFHLLIEQVPLSFRVNAVVHVTHMLS